MEILDNVNSTVLEDLRRTIRPGGKISVAAAFFSIYAYAELKEELEQVESFRFIFTSPTFTTDRPAKERREFYIPRLNREKSVYGSEFEVRLRNELSQRAIARECADWIRSKADFRSNVTGENMPGFMNVEDASYFPVNSFTTVDLGCERGNNAYNPVQRSTAQENARYYLRLFEDLWNDKKKLADVTDAVIESISAAYTENSPEFIYFVALYNIFNEFLDDISEDVLPNEATGFKSSKIWGMLFNFQRDAALAIINKLEKYNGCILADSVGLGKTFTALAVIKYYENRNKSVLVLCPKKLANNWNTYKDNYTNNPIAADRLGYTVLFHTDLSRRHGFSNGIDLSRLNWGNFDLVVIDESHNFRNGGNSVTDESKRDNRYDRLLKEIVRTGVKTKVLMLSATPVNNRFYDLRNQLQLAYEGNAVLLDRQLNTTHTVDEIFRSAQRAFTAWSKFEPENRTTERLLSMLDYDFFELLDSVTIARSRKHIQRYYDTADIGTFPKRLPPQSVFPKLTSLPNAINYKEIYDLLDRLELTVYMPSYYILPSRLSKYADTFGDREDRLTQQGREAGIRRLMAINLMKRLESSVYAFRLTLKRIDDLISSTIEKIERFQGQEQKLDLFDATGYDLDADDSEEDDLFMIGRKVKIDLADMDYVSWKISLAHDKETFDLLAMMVDDITPEYDTKLTELKHLIADKQEHPLNPGNKKIIIFTAFADTAEYLYKHIAPYAKEQYGLYTAMITGTVDGRTNAPLKQTDMNTVLTCFSPVSKDKYLLLPNDPNEIDILIATDCISEGQNLQDCDYLVNFDIHWNPVRIIQRFGRIDRIGSKNTQIQLVNFWPDVTLDEYINLKSRVESRMKIVDLTATGDDDLLSPEEKADLEYRKAQLKRLQEEVVDIEEMQSGISIMDLGLNEFRLDLLSYIKENPDVESAPMGIHSVVPATPETPPGVIYVLKNRSGEVNADHYNRLHPFYMVYIKEDGSVLIDHLSPKKLLDSLRFACKGQDSPIPAAYRPFNTETKDGKDMRRYSTLLSGAIRSVINKKEESALDAFLSGGQISFFEEKLKGLDDFELVCFLVVKDITETTPAKNEYRVVVAGSRDYTDYARLCEELDRLLAGKKNITIISGASHGADRLGERYAAEHGLRVERFPARWGLFHQGAGPRRNKQMVQSADAVIVFWNGKSSGSKNIIDIAEQENKPCTVIDI